MPDVPVPKAADHSADADRSLRVSAQGSPSPRHNPAWVLVARLIRPQGRLGELIAEILTDFPERFHQRSRLFLIPPERLGTRAREMCLENFWFLRSRMVMKFQGIDSINEAETLRGFAVAIPSEERVPLDSGSVYLSELIGCRLVDLNRGGAEVGEIADVDRESSNTELLVVRRPGKEFMIPFVAEYLVRLDTAKHIVEMRLPEGLLEINEPMTDEEKQEAPGTGRATESRRRRGARKKKI
ncbi:MAG TPA: ribosome maturation factor RimM [Acidobacteriaceae bacterium]|jgi:16S rRNA processing protein RimM